MNAVDNNNKKKFAFLSTETIPDYRPRELLPHNEKIQKTTNNQTTKFHQLQQMFGNKNHETNNDVIPLYKQINNPDNDKFYEFANDDEVRTLNFIDVDFQCLSLQLRKVVKKQSEEIRRLEIQVSHRDRRIRELEDQLKKLLQK